MKVSLGPYGKAIVALLGTAALVLGDNVLDVPDVVQIALAVATVLGVFGVKNTPPSEPTE